MNTKLYVITKKTMPNINIADFDSACTDLRDATSRWNIKNSLCKDNPYKLYAICITDYYIEEVK